MRARWAAARASGVGAGGTGEAGSAVVEFLGVALLLLVPLVYLVLVLAQLQAAGFAVEGAARDAARAYAVAEDPAAGAGRAVAAVGLALADQGVPADPARALTLGCSGADCLAAGSTVTATVRVAVPLPFVPAVVRDVVPVEVPVSATRTAAVDRFRGAP
nr:pilus assembly protein [Cellulomonas endophytica]